MEAWPSHILCHPADSLAPASQDASFLKLPKCCPGPGPSPDPRFSAPLMTQTFLYPFQGSLWLCQGNKPGPLPRHKSLSLQEFSFHLSGTTGIPQAGVGSYSYEKPCSVSGLKRHVRAEAQDLQFQNYLHANPGTCSSFSFHPLLPCVRESGRPCCHATRQKGIPHSCHLVERRIVT